MKVTIDFFATYFQKVTSKKLHKQHVPAGLYAFLVSLDKVSEFSNDAIGCTSFRNQGRAIV